MFKAGLCLNTLAWNRTRVVINRDSWSAKAFAKDVFIDHERKLEDRRRSDTVIVLTINYAD
jgi:hypothetical protein